MTLLELCEPLFLYICRLNRSARKGLAVDHARTATEIRAIFQQIRAEAGAQAALVEPHEKIELVLLCFVDYMIKESRLPFASDWKEMAAQEPYRQLAGDEKFFDLLDETLAERTTSADERLAVYFNCIGLGFGGFYAHQPEVLRRKMMEMSGRIRDKMDAEAASRLLPEAYDKVNTANLGQPVGASLVGIAIALTGFLAVTLAANMYLWRAGSNELRQTLQEVGRLGQTALPAATGNPTQAPPSAVPPPAAPTSAPASPTPPPTAPETKKQEP